MCTKFATQSAFYTQSAVRSLQSAFYTFRLQQSTTAKTTVVETSVTNNSSKNGTLCCGSGWHDILF